MGHFGGLIFVQLMLRHQPRQKGTVHASSYVMARRDGEKGSGVVV
jgi:hypothetical protein